MSRADIPMESPNKYGRFDDDISELVAGVTGGVPVKRDGVVDRAESSGEDTVDEDFLRTAGNPRNKYGS